MDRSRLNMRTSRSCTDNARRTTASSDDRRKPPKKAKKKKVEWSKFFAGTIAYVFGGVGVWATYRYYQLCEMAISTGSTSMPDASLAVTFVQIVIGALISYLLYQAGLKSSRNKYGVDENGEPYKRKHNDEAEG